MLPGSKRGSPRLFAAITFGPPGIEATEEAIDNSAIDNSTFKAPDGTANGHTVKALPVRETVELLRKHGAIAAK